jgi:hypothetical protein
MQRFHALCALTAALLLAIPATALAADSSGGLGIIKQVQINGPKSDAHLQFHGKIKVRTNNGVDEYFWGGNKCSAFDLSEHDEDILLEAFHTRLRTRIVPLYKKSGNNKCLVGYTLRAPSRKDNLR